MTLRRSRPVREARSRLSAAVFFVLWPAAAALFVGCTRPAPEQPLQRISIAFQKWVGYGLFYLAQEKGFCREEGIELMFVDEQIDSARRDAFKQGILDCEAGTIDLLVTKRDQGAPVVGVLKLDDSYGADGIAAAAEIGSVKDLTGKTVVFARDDVGETFISYLLQKNGMSLDDIRIVPAAVDDAYRRFLDGKADAVATWEPFLSRALARTGAHILATSRDESGVIVDTLNVREDLVKNNPALVKKLMRAWFKALDYHRAHADDADAVISRYYGISAQEYRRQIGGLRWEGYAEELAEARAGKWRETFDLISELKSQTGRIAGRPQAEEGINTALLESLYEDRR